jgi:iron(III) transport system substrate-binding protein
MAGHKHAARRVIAALAAAMTLGSPTIAQAGSPSAGSPCPSAGDRSGALVCENQARSGQRPRLRWTRPAPTTATAPAATIAAPATAAPARPTRLTVYSGRTYGIEEVYARFTRETGIALDVVTGADPANRTRLAAEGSRTPADVYLTVDIASLHRAAEDGLLARIDSPTLRRAVPAELRDGADRWFGLTRRARVIYVNTSRVRPEEMPTRYEDLAAPRWAGRLCNRPASHVYTQSLAANIMAAYGNAAPGIIAGIAANTRGDNWIDSDTRIIETIDAGGCDAGIANTYYWFRPGLKKGNVRLVFPNQGDGERGVHVNVSGAGVVAASDDKAAAQRFIEWLATDASSDFADGNAEFPVNPSTPVRADVRAIATFKADQGRIDDYSRLQPAALVVLTEAGWR